MIYVFYQEFCHGPDSKDGSDLNFCFRLEEFDIDLDFDDIAFSEDSDRLIIKELKVEKNKVRKKRQTISF